MPRIRPVHLAALGAVIALAASCIDPPPPPTPPEPGITPGTCYGTGASADDGFDFRYDGPDGVAGNGTYLSSTDGSCSGVPIYELTAVLAAGRSEAADECVALGDDTPPEKARWYQLHGAPADLWFCPGSLRAPLGEPPAPGTCLGTHQLGHTSLWPVDVEVVGPMSEADNLVGRSSSDGTCSGFRMGVATGVFAATAAEAQTACVDRRVAAGIDPPTGWPEEWTPGALWLYGDPQHTVGLWFCYGSLRPASDAPDIDECYAPSGGVRHLGVKWHQPTVGTTAFFEADDPTCTGPGVPHAWTVVRATEGTALAACEAAVGAGVSHMAMASLYPGADDVFMCFPASPDGTP